MADDYSNDTTTTGVLPWGGQVAGNLESTSDADWFRLDLKANTGYYFTPSMANGTVPSIEVWLGDASRIDYSNQLGLLYTNDLYNPYLPSASGTYYVEIGKGKGNYTIGLHEAHDDSSNDPAAARVLTATSPVAGTFDYAFDKDQFRFSAVEGMTYTVTLSSDNGSLGPASFLRLTLQGNRPGSQQGGATTSYTFTADHTGDYLFTATMASSEPPAAGGLAYHVSLSAADRTGPTVVSGSGAVDGAIVVNLDEAARLEGAGRIELRDRYGWLIDSWSAGDSRMHLSGTTLTLDSGRPGVLVPGKHSIHLNGDILVDANGNVGRGNFYNVIDIDRTSAGGVAFEGFDAMLGLTGSVAATDAVVYRGQLSNYRIAHTSKGFEVTSRSGAVVQLDDIERVMFTDSDEVVAISLDGDLGQAFRLYTAAFGRVPDMGGLGYWLHAAEHGVSLGDMARSFIASKESTDLYGAHPDNSAFLNSLYQNVLHRDGDAGGAAYWMGRLAGGAERGDVLAAFSESAENQAQAVELIGNGIVYTPYG